MITIAEGLQAYRIYAQAAGRSPATISWINNGVKLFMEFLGDEPKYCSEVTASDLRRFIIEYGQRHAYQKHPFSKTKKTLVKAISIQTYVRAIKAFFSYLESDDLIKENVILKVKKPKAPVIAVPTFTQQEIERLLKAPNRQRKSGFRDYALILTFIDTNARLSELCNLDEKDVDLENGYLRLMGKGGKERFTPIGFRLCRILMKYKLKYRPQPLGTEAFWLTQTGQRIKPNRVEFLIRSYGKQVGLERCYPHKLRHTASILFLRNGGDPFSLQKKLGHSSLQMTRHYCNLADTDVKRQHMKFGVVDKLNI